MMLSWRQQVVTLVRAARPPFLLLVPILIGLATAQVYAEQSDIHLSYLGLVILSALAAAASSNLLNEFFDFASGLDQQTQATPFSGGSKALIERPSMQNSVKWLGLLLLSISVWSGLALVAAVGWPLLLLGLVGVALVIAYTPIINRTSWLCLLSPGIGYGVVIFLGAYWAIRGEVGGLGVVLAPIVVLLTSALLLLNQFPDVDADAIVGRRHAVIAWGKKRAWQVFVLLHLISYGWLLLMVSVALVPWIMLWGMVFLPLSLWVIWRSHAFIQHAVQVPVLAANVVVVLGVPIVLAMSLLG